MKALGAVGLIVSATALVIGFGYLVGGKPSAPADQPSANEITDAKAKLELTALIRANGFECEGVKLAWADGETPYGPAATAYCGPAGAEGVYAAQKYRVYPKRLKVEVEE